MRAARKSLFIERYLLLLASHVVLSCNRLSTAAVSAYYSTLEKALTPPRGTVGLEGI